MEPKPYFDVAQHKWFGRNQALCREVLLYAEITQLEPNKAALCSKRTKPILKDATSMRYHHRVRLLHNALVAHYSALLFCISQRGDLVELPSTNPAITLLSIFNDLPSYVSS